MNLSVMSITALAFFLMRGGDFGTTGCGRRNRTLRGARRHAGSLCCDEITENTYMSYLSEN